MGRKVAVVVTTQTKPETPESRAFAESTAQEFRELITSIRRDADELAAEGSQASRAEAKRLRWHATRCETELRQLTDMLEKKGEWATGHYVPKPNGT